MKNKFYTILDCLQAAGMLYLLGYFINIGHRSHALHLRIEQSEYTSISDVRSGIVNDIRKISPKCAIKIDDSEYDDGTVGIRVDNITKKERIQLESVIPYWYNVHIG